MRCVDCHGGDPSSLKQEEAHANRKAHPILNEDVSKCQECHPEECNERVEIFDQSSGISQVLVAVPYETATSFATEPSPDLVAVAPDTYEDWISAMEFISPVVLSSMVIALYLLHRKHHNKHNTKET
jgi:hypothetical protein